MVGIGEFADLAMGGGLSQESARSPALVERYAPLAFDRVLVRSGTFDHVFEVGVHTVLGDRSSGAFDLFELASGSVSPARGRVSLAGRSLCSSPELRRRVAGLAPLPLPDFTSVGELVRATAQLRGHAPEPVFELLASWQAEELASRAPGDLSPETAALVQLAMALAHREARLLLLWEPFATNVDRGWLHRTLCARGADAVVLVFTSTLPEPALSGSVVRFGTTSLSLAPRVESAPRRGSVWVAADPVERLARELVKLPGIVGAEILVGEPGLLCVGIAPEPALVEQVCASVLAIAREHDVRILGMRYESEGAA